jgi:hypothetical protein
MDEAGLSNPAEEPYLVVAAIIVHADKQLARLQEHLTYLVRKHIPDDQQDGFVFHAMEIFHGSGKGVFNRKASDWATRWPLARRLEIAADLATIPKDFGLQIALGYMHRSDPDFPDTMLLPGTQTVIDRASAQYAIAYLTCIVQVEGWMREHTLGEVCMLVVEDSPTYRSVTRDAHNYYQRPEIGPKLPLDIRRFLPLQRIKEDPLFQANRASSVLQIADFCAYVYKRFLMNREDSRYLPFFDPWREQIVRVI